MFNISELLEAAKGKLISGDKKVIVTGVSIDSRSIIKDELFIALKGDNFDGHNFIDEAIAKGAKAIIVHSLPPIALTKKRLPIIQVKDTTLALGGIALFHRKRFDIPLIAVTGSNGKTTAKEMISYCLSKRFNVLKNDGTKNNHIGVPLALLSLRSRHELAVLELGTSHFGEIDYLAKICLPNVAVITNIGPAHLENFGSLSGVFKEKSRLINNLRKPYIVILNSDDRFLRKELLLKTKKPFVLGFGVKKSGDFIASNIRYSQEKTEFLLQAKYNFALKTLGRHNVYNALAAAAVGRMFGIGYDELSRRLADFVFPDGRLKALILNEVTFIDDTYNANPFSLKNALDTLSAIKAKGRKIFVMGDMKELGINSNAFHRQIGKRLLDCCDVFVSVGSLSKLAAIEAGACGFDARNIFSCESSLDAKEVLFNKILPNRDDIVLLKGSRAMKMEQIIKTKPITDNREQLY